MFFEFSDLMSITVYHKSGIKKQLSSVKLYILPHAGANYIQTGKGVRNMNRLALTLVIIGALNWGILSICGLDLVGFLFGGQGTVLSRIIYGIVGLAGIWACSFYFKLRNASDAA